MRKFLAKEDIKIFGIPICQKGEIIQIDDYFKVEKHNNQFSIPLKDIQEDKRFEEIKQDLDIEIIEIPEEEDSIEKKYRIQLDVFTTRKKLIQIENLLRKTIEDYL